MKIIIDNQSLLDFVGEYCRAKHLIKKEKGIKE